MEEEKFVDPGDGRTSLIWLLILYYIQLGILPLIGATLWYRDFNAFNKIWF